MSRELQWFEKTGDDLVGECVLGEIDPVEFRKAFNLPSDDPLVDAYLVTELQVPYLQPLVNHDIRLDQYDYFVATYRDPFLFPRPGKDSEQVWIVKRCLDTVEHKNFIQQISDILDGKNYTSEYEGGTCEFPHNLEETEEPFVGVRVRYSDNNEIIVSEETLRECILIACQRYLELYPEKKPEMANILEKLAK